MAPPHDHGLPVAGDLIRMTAEAGLAAGKSVGVCDEAEGREMAADALRGQPTI